MADAIVKCCCLFGVFTPLVVVYTFDILSLEHDSYSESLTLCPESNIWIFLLSCMLFTLSLSLLPKINGPALLSCIVIFFCMIFWGRYELYETDCAKNLKGTSLYHMAYVHYVILIITNTFNILGCAADMCCPSDYTRIE